MMKLTKTDQSTFVYDGETNVGVNGKSIVRVFNQQIILGEGVVRLRKGSQSGEVLEELETSSGKVLASGAELVVLPDHTLPYETKVFLTVDDGAVIAKNSGERCTFLNETSERTFSFTTEDPIGKPLDGGTILSKSNGRYLIVSPKRSEMILPWDKRHMAISRTQEITGTSDWFVPSSSLLINEDLNVKGFWFRFDDDNTYWTSDGYSVNMSNLVVKERSKDTSSKVRTFKYSII